MELMLPEIGTGWRFPTPLLPPYNKGRGWVAEQKRRQTQRSASLQYSRERQRTLETEKESNGEEEDFEEIARNR